MKGHCRNCPDHIPEDAAKIIRSRTTDKLLAVVDGIDKRYSKEFQLAYFGRLDWKERLIQDKRIRRERKTKIGGVENAGKM